MDIQTLQILEYCDKLNVIEREQFYIDLLVWWGTSTE